jgi:hypothetical protein
MKKSILIFVLISLSKVGHSQEVQHSSNGSDSLTALSADILGYDPVAFGNHTAEIASGWSKEEKEWFKSTFVFKRGEFKVPETPIVDPFAEK